MPGVFYFVLMIFVHQRNKTNKQNYYTLQTEQKKGKTNEIGISKNPKIQFFFNSSLLSFCFVLRIFDTLLRERERDMRNANRIDSIAAASTIQMITIAVLFSFC
jgi:hypothetical protein